MTTDTKKQVQAPAPDINWGLLGIWLAAGNYSTKPEEGKKLQQYVVKRSQPLGSACYSAARTYPTLVLVPLVQGFISTREGLRPKQAVMQMVRCYDPELRDELRQGLHRLGRGDLSGSVIAALSSPAVSQASLLVAIGEALDLLMRDTEFYMFGASKTSAAALLGG